MSIPTSLRVGPFTSTVLIKNRYVIFYIFLIWVSIIPAIFEFWLYWQLLWTYERPLHFFIFLPLLIFGVYVTMVLTSLVFARILLSIVNAIHKPREGVFLRIPSDKDYRYWIIRNTIKRWPVWLAHKFPFPFLDNLCFKMFGVKTKFSNSLFEGWVDTEFIEFGENVIIGQAAIIQSACIIGNLLIIKKTIIGDNVRIGAHTIVSPGTHIGNNCMLGAKSLTLVDQELQECWIYVGVPSVKYKKNRFFEDGLEEIIAKSQNIDVEKLREKYEKIYDKRETSHYTYKERKELKKAQLEEEKRRLKQGM